MKTIKSSEQVDIPQKNSEDWFDSARIDIERLIEHVIIPYVDYGNIFLHRDELRNECWRKVATLLSGGWLERCQTRQKFFALLKVSLKNHVKSHITRHAFTSKRTGIDPAALRNKQVEGLRKAVDVRLDDPNEAFQLTSCDSALQMDFLLRDFMQLLAPGQHRVLCDLLVSNGSVSANQRSVHRLRDLWDAYIRGEPGSAGGMKASTVVL